MAASENVAETDDALLHHAKGHDRMEATASQTGARPNPVPVARTVALDAGYVRATPTAGSKQVEILIGNIASGHRRLNTFAAVAAAGVSLAGPYALSAGGRRLPLRPDGHDGLR